MIDEAVIALTETEAVDHAWPDELHALHSEVEAVARSAVRGRAVDVSADMAVAAARSLGALGGRSSTDVVLSLFRTLARRDSNPPFTRVVDSQVTFVIEGDGPASALVLHQNGRDITAKRLP